MSLRYVSLVTVVGILVLSPAVMAHQGRQGDATTLKKEATAPTREIPIEYDEIYVDDGGSVSGVVRFLSSDTAAVGIKDAVVYIKGMQRGKTFARFLEEKTPFIDQKGVAFVPHVLIVPVGSTVELRNTDPEMHNLHSYSVKNASFNEGIPSAGKPIRKRFDYVEVVRIGCDIHKEMAAWVVVRDNPYYCLTGEDGSFKIVDIPSGIHRLAVWHEDFDREELAALCIDVNVEPNKKFEVDFYLSHKRQSCRDF
ncbi:MAG: hypothetical protein ACE5IC_09540 [Candidatus Brocadiales bacterium]